MKTAVLRVHRRKWNCFSRTLCTVSFLMVSSLLFFSFKLVSYSFSHTQHFFNHQRRIQQPFFQLWERAPIRCAGYASGPQRAHLLPMSSGLLWRDDRLWQHWCEFCIKMPSYTQSEDTWDRYGHLHLMLMNVCCRLYSEPAQKIIKFERVHGLEQK